MLMLNYNRVILFVFTILGLTGWLTATFELLPTTVTFWLQFSSAILALLTIGYGAICSLRERIFSMDMLATIAIIASIISGEYFPATLVAFMLLGGEMLEDHAQHKSTNAIQKLIEEQPQTATVLRNEQEIQVNPQEVKIGETVIVKPGAKIPVDGIIQKGHATINQASVTGESVPVEKTEGATVYSGTIVQQGAIFVVATAIGEKSTYGKIISMVKEAKEKKAPIERVVDKYAKYFHPNYSGTWNNCFCINQRYNAHGLSIYHSLSMCINPRYASSYCNKYGKCGKKGNSHTKWRNFGENVKCRCLSFG